MYTFLCEDSISGIFSGVYEAWAGKYNREEVFFRTGEIGNYELFMEYKRIENDLGLSSKVSRTIRRRFGEETYEWICYALWSEQEDKANAVYQTIRYGIENRCGYGLRNYLTEQSIQRVMELGRGTYNEAHHYLGFVRFMELQNGLLYSEIEAKNYVLEILADHFADRLPGENWIIYDKAHKEAALHPALGDWLVTDEKVIEQIVQSPLAKYEQDFQNMWRRFCQSITIEARENLKLQRQNMPLRFRKNMPDEGVIQASFGRQDYERQDRR